MASTNNTHPTADHQSPAPAALADACVAFAGQLAAYTTTVAILRVMRDRTVAAPLAMAEEAHQALFCSECRQRLPEPLCPTCRAEALGEAHADALTGELADLRLLLAQLTRTTKDETDYLLEKLEDLQDRVIDLENGGDLPRVAQFAAQIRHLDAVTSRLEQAIAAKAEAQQKTDATLATALATLTQLADRIRRLES
jgi:hypothetical protein